MSIKETDSLRESELNREIQYLKNELNESKHSRNEYEN